MDLSDFGPAGLGGHFPLRFGENKKKGAPVGLYLIFMAALQLLICMELYKHEGQFSTFGF
jgi:hypothetical protein